MSTHYPSNYPTRIFQNTRISNDLYVQENIIISQEILTSSTQISKNKDITYFNDDSSYSLDGADLPVYTLGKPTPTPEETQTKQLCLLDNPLPGNIKVSCSASGGLGSFNLTFDEKDAKLVYVNNNWQLVGSPPWYVDTQQENFINTTIDRKSVV